MLYALCSLPVSAAEPIKQYRLGPQDKLKIKVSMLREHETPFVRAGVSPHAPYTVCGRQLEMVADYALAERLPLMMHAAESSAEELFMREGAGPFADSLAKRGVEWNAPGVSTIQYLEKLGVLRTRPLLAHCINADDADIETIKQTETRVAHCCARRRSRYSFWKTAA